MPSTWLEVLIDASPSAMGFISVEENRYVHANAAMVDLYGLPLEEILNTDPYSLALRITHPDDLVPEQKLFAELASGKVGSYRFEKRFVHPDGTFRWGLLTMAALFDGAGETTARVLRGVTLQVVETTEQRRAEAELRHAQRVDALGRLSAGVAHDFNNLLTVIVGHSQALRSLLAAPDVVGLRKEADEDIDAILAASERGAQLTRQLLAHGRRASATARPFVLSEEAAALERLLSRTLGESVDVQHTFHAKGAILADPAEVGQVLMNLVLNARDAIGARGQVRVETRDVSASDAAGDAALGSGEWVALVVSDDGHGMTDDVRARMFEPFFTTREERPGLQGNGLGLATVQRIVADAGGRIDVASAPGRGTTITVYFPRVELPDPATPVAAAAPASLAPNSRRILVIEDDPAVRSLLGTVLLGAHYRVSVARDGSEGLRMLDGEIDPFHLVVTDLVMPEKGGLQVAETLRARGRPERILFISGYSDHAPVELAAHGALLPKPFTPEQLLQAVARALRDGEMVSIA